MDIYFNNKKLKIFLENEICKLIANKKQIDIVKENLLVYFDSRDLNNYSGNSIIDNISGFTANLANNVSLEYSNITKHGLKVENNYIFEISGLNNLEDKGEGFTVELVLSKMVSDMLFYNTLNYFSFSYTDTSDTKKTVGVYEHNCYNENNVLNTTTSLIDINNYVHLQFVFNPNGTASVYINGYKGYLDLSASDFKSYSNLFNSITRLKFNNASENTIFSCFRIYNKALTEKELKNNLASEISKLYLLSVEIYPKDINIKLGSDFTFFKKINPSIIINNIDEKLVPSNNNLYAINKDTINAKNIGNSVVTLNCKHKDEIISDTVNCNVVSSLNLEIPTLQRDVYTGIVIGNKINELYIGEEYAVMAFLTPYYPTYDNLIKFVSSDTSVCTVNYGVVKAVGNGTCTITATDPNNLYTDSFTIVVSEKIEDIILEEDIYYVEPDIYGIKLDNTNSINTTLGIINALSYASTNNYKKIVFPKGTYLTSIQANETIDDNIYLTGTIKIPSNMIVDFSNSTINIEPVNSSTIKYTMFAFQGGCKNSKIINATILGERYSMNISPGKSEEHSLCVLFYSAENCGLENCTIGESNGFNIQGLRGVRGGSFNYAAVMQDNIEAGSYMDNGEKDNVNIDNNWRTINKIDISMLGDHFELGHAQYYSGYLINARLYDIIFYDEFDQVIKVQRNCIHFFRYDKPVNAKYVNLVFHQPTQPTGTGVGDHSYMISLYTLNEPYKCYIRNCTIRDNYSTGIAMCGGKRWLMEYNTFIHNIGRDPSCHVDYEDGWDSMIGDVWRYNIFEKGGGGFLNVDGHSLVVHNNIFNSTGFGQRDRCQNYRVYNNIFNNCVNIKFSCQSEGVVAENILYNTKFTTDTYYHAAHLYDVRYFNNYTIE